MPPGNDALLGLVQYLPQSININDYFFVCKILTTVTHLDFIIDKKLDIYHGLCLQSIV